MTPHDPPKGALISRLFRNSQCKQKTPRLKEATTMTPSDPGPLPAPHPRQGVVERARRELDEHLQEWADCHALTTSERFLLLAEALAGEAGRCVQVERRGKEEQR